MATQSDDFADNLNEWTIESGSWQIYQGKAYLPASTGWMRYTNSSLSGADHFSEIEWHSANVINDQGGGPAARMDTGGAKTFYNAEWLFAPGQGVPYLVKFVSGTRTVLATGSGHDIVDGDVLRVTCNGTTISADLNSTEYGSVTDSSISSGSAGISGDVPSGGRDILIESWNAADLAAPPAGGLFNLKMTGIGR